MSGNGGPIRLDVGSPSDAALRSAAKIMMGATEERLAVDLAPMRYGDACGEKLFLQQLATFLAEEYGDCHGLPVDRLVATAGATNGLHLLLTFLFPLRCTVYVERYTYMLALDIFEQLAFDVVPVDVDEEGMLVDNLLAALLLRRPSHRYEGQPVDQVLYLVPTFQNPTGTSVSENRAKSLIKIAREHRMLIICDDVYNLLHYEGDRPPKRLFAVDDEGEEEYKGNVVSNASFSKYVAPGVRCGWMELPRWMRGAWWSRNGVVSSGGPSSQYTSSILAVALRDRSVTAHLDVVRRQLADSMRRALSTLHDHMPEGGTFSKPKGGYFIWLCFPPGIDTAELLLKCKPDVVFSVGARFSADSGDKFAVRCARISVSRQEVAVLCRGIVGMCVAAKEILLRQPSLP